MSKLSQETIDRIRESASDKYNLSSQEGERIGYQVGATEWAGGAQELVDALKTIENTYINEPGLVIYIKAVLAKYKEEGNG